MPTGCGRRNTFPTPADLLIRLVSILHSGHHTKPLSAGALIHSRVCRYVRPTQPLQAFSAHAHWVWQARYNPHNDALLLTCSSDGTVGLWHTPSLALGSSSSPSPASSAAVTPRSVLGRDGGGDGKVQSFEDHEDSVYGESQLLFSPFCQQGLTRIQSDVRPLKGSGKMSAEWASIFVAFAVSAMLRSIVALQGDDKVLTPALSMSTCPAQKRPGGGGGGGARFRISRTTTTVSTFRASSHISDLS